MGLLIVGGAVSFQIFKEATRTQLSKTQLDAVKPLDGKIEDDVILNLSKRPIFSNEDLRSVPLEKRATESGSIASPSAIMSR